MSKNHADYQTDEEIKTELAYLKDHFAEEYAAQSAARDAWYKDPANRAEETLARMDIVTQLYKAREEAGLTQKELAERMQTNQTFIAAIERGRKNVTLTTLVRYARACGKTLNVLML